MKIHLVIGFEKPLDALLTFMNHLARRNDAQALKVAELEAQVKELAARLPSAEAAAPPPPPEGGVRVRQYVRTRRPKTAEIDAAVSAGTRDALRDAGRPLPPDVPPQI